MPAFADRDLEQRIQNAQRDIKSWAEGSDLWRDSGFTSYAERVQGEPGEEAVVFILTAMGTLLACWMKILTLDRELSSIRFVGHTVSGLKTMTAAPTTSLRRRKKCRRPTMSTSIGNGYVA